MKLELQKKLIDIVGSDKYREVAKALEEYGLEVITPVSQISVKLPTIEITSTSPSGSLRPDLVRRFAFKCLINGQELPELSKIELDPFDIQDGEAYKVKMTLSPFFGGDNDKV